VKPSKFVVTVAPTATPPVSRAKLTPVANNPTMIRRLAGPTTLLERTATTSPKVVTRLAEKPRSEPNVPPFLSRGQSFGSAPADG
jgi:hypothetical protein